MATLSAGAMGSLCRITALLRADENPPDDPMAQTAVAEITGTRTAEARASADSAPQPNLPPVETLPPAAANQTPAALSEDALTAPPTCTGAAQKPIPRVEWGAQPPLVSLGGYGEYGPYDASRNPGGWLEYRQPLAQVLDTLIVHHSALPLSDGPLEIQRLHQQEKDFADIGYQYLIDQNGYLYEGRALNVRGAHTYGHNYGSVGICLIGNFEEIQPSREQLYMLRSLLACLNNQYPLVATLAGHRDYNSGTLCPGANLAPLLPGYASELGLAYGG